MQWTRCCYNSLLCAVSLVVTWILSFFPDILVRKITLDLICSSVDSDGKETRTYRESLAPLPRWPLSCDRRQDHQRQERTDPEKRFCGCMLVLPDMNPETSNKTRQEFRNHCDRNLLAGERVATGSCDNVCNRGSIRPATYRPFTRLPLP